MFSRVPFFFKLKDIYKLVDCAVFSLSEITCFALLKTIKSVILRYGAIEGTADPGLHFKVPGIDEVIKISTRTLKAEMPKVSSYSKDQQPADLQMSINVTVVSSEVDELYKQFGDLQSLFVRVIQPKVLQETKTVFGRFSAVRSIQQREELNQEVESTIRNSLKAYKMIVVNSVQIENIDFSSAYEQSIEDRMKAEVEVQRIKQNLEREKIQAEIMVTKAKANADSKVKQAEAEAKAIELKSKAEAESINIKGQALRDNPNIISLIEAEKWDGVLPKTILPSSTVPIINTD